MAGGKYIVDLPNSITPNFAVDKGYITGKRSNEIKKNVLAIYGEEIRERLFQNIPYSIVYENNGKKKRNIYTVGIKRVNFKNSKQILCFPNFDISKITDKEILKLRIESTDPSVKLKVKCREIRERLRVIPTNERYKFPRE